MLARYKSLASDGANVAQCTDGAGDRPFREQALTRSEAAAAGAPKGFDVVVAHPLALLDTHLAETRRASRDRPGFGLPHDRAAVTCPEAAALDRPLLADQGPSPHCAGARNFSARDRNGTAGS